jgi:hypothetical protein
MPGSFRFRRVAIEIAVVPDATDLPGMGAS